MVGISERPPTFLMDYLMKWTVVASKKDVSV